MKVYVPFEEHGTMLSPLPGFMEPAKDMTGIS